MITQLFSPQDDIRRVWISCIASETQEIHLALFGLSDPAIESALEAAIRRGVKVTMLCDRRQSQNAYDLHARLQTAGATVVIKPGLVLLHDKMGIFLSTASAIVGSYNLSRNAPDQDNSVVWFDNEPTHVCHNEAAFERMYQLERMAMAPGRIFRPPAEYL